MARYSASSVLDLDTVSCFLLFQEINDEPRKTQCLLHDHYFSCREDRAPPRRNPSLLEKKGEGCQVECLCPGLKEARWGESGRCTDRGVIYLSLRISYSCP
ncbi:hypothetical protein FNV43_RR08266 [Rhamnella rubrinervis]|uniref:Uncharacterized protein n=1 Tax=Rhamnella rubrinervis TaxID=2594499 RepID=A0A8K0MNH5_9ROSA|nr:hypothetical protein FNV43_RR08266 [Rhamnella rubrinervis]